MGIATKAFSKINRSLLPVKFHYFIFMGALACVLPFRTIFAKQIGLSGTEIGLVFCIVPILRIVTNPLFGFIIDYFKKFRLTISLTLIILAFSHVFLVFIPPKSTTSPKNANVTDDDFYMQIKYLSQQNQTFKDVFDIKLIIYNEYRKTGNSRSFLCEVECPDTTNENITDRDVLDCSSKIRFTMKVFVKVLECGMDLELKQVEVLAFDDSIQNSTLFTFNDSLKTKSWIVTSENCSEASAHSVLVLGAEDFNIKKYLPSVFVKYVSLPVLKNLGNDQKMYFIMQDFITGLQTNVSFLDSIDCSFEYKCNTKKCFSTEQNSSHESEASNFKSVQFWSIFVLFSVGCVTIGSVIFMMDAVCYELLKDQKDLFGQQRLWGSIGWGLGALAGGYLNQILSTDTGDDYALSFYLLAILLFIDIIPVWHLNIKDLKYSPNIFKDVCFLLTNSEIIYNIFIVTIIGGLSGFIWNYQFWFMQEIGSGQILLGLSQIVECICELPCFFVAGWIIRKIGHYNCCNITLLCFGLRYLCFVFMYNPWWSLAVALFNGPTFGLFYSSLTVYAKNLAPDGTEATVQSLLHLFFEGIGAAAGNMLGGIGLDKLGSRTSFMYAAILSFLFLIINVFMTVLFTRKGKDFLCPFPLMNLKPLMDNKHLNM